MAAQLVASRAVLSSTELVKDIYIERAVLTKNITLDHPLKRYKSNTYFTHKKGNFSPMLN
jgi:hypothetical protein